MGSGAQEGDRQSTDKRPPNLCKHNLPGKRPNVVINTMFSYIRCRMSCHTSTRIKFTIHGFQRAPVKVGSLTPLKPAGFIDTKWFLRMEPPTVPGISTWVKRFLPRFPWRLSNWWQAKGSSKRLWKKATVDRRRITFNEAFSNVWYVCMLSLVRKVADICTIDKCFAHIIEVILVSKWCLLLDVGKKQPQNHPILMQDIQPSSQYSMKEVWTYDKYFLITFSMRSKHEF